MKTFSLKFLKGLMMTLASFVILVKFGSSVSFANMPPLPVVAEIVTHVGFAPPEHTGSYYFQVLYDGRVQSIDNKNNLKELGVLSAKKIENLKNAIKEVPSNIEVIPGKGNQCMDAPSIAINVYKDNGDKVTISTRFGCITNSTNNYFVNDIAEWLRLFKYTMEKEFGSNEVESSIKLFGQEGYGSPQPSDPVDNKLENLSCESEHGETKLNLKLTEQRGTQNYILELERFLEGVNTTPYRESFLVSKFVVSRPGASVVYKDLNESIKLKVQYTVTPRPDGKLYAQLEKIDDDIVLQYSLLCTRF